MKRFIAILLAAILILALVGCGSKRREIIELTLSTEDAEAILLAAGVKLPDENETPAAGSTIQWFSFWDGFHNYGDDEVVNTGYWTFKNKYGCEIEWVETTWADSNADLANLVLSGKSPDFAQAGEGIFPSGALKGMYRPVDDFIDYDDPLWEGVRDFAMDYYSLNGRPYFIITDSTFDKVICYNRRIMTEWGFDDPAELYYNDQWTWNEFYEMCADFSNRDEDRFALDGWFFPAGIMHSSGTNIVSYDPEQMKFVSNVDDPRLERAENLLYDLTKNECAYPISENGWKQRNDVNGSGMKDGLLLFYIAGVWSFQTTVDETAAVFGDVREGELMLVPLPRDDEGDGKYHLESGVVGYTLVKGGQNPEGVALYCACERFKVLDPTVVNIDRRQLKEIYLWSDEMLEMWDECYRISSEAYKNGEAIVLYGDGLGNANSAASQFETQGFSPDVKTWAQLKEANGDALEYALEELNSEISSFTYSD